MCYQAEKTLADFADKLTDELKGRIEAARRETHDAIIRKDAAAAREKSEQLGKLLKEAGAVIYAQRPDAGVFRETKIPEGARVVEPGGALAIHGCQARLLRSAGDCARCRRGRRQGRLPQARHAVPSGPQQGAGGGGALQGDRRGLCRAFRREEARRVRRGRLHGRLCRGFVRRNGGARRGPQRGADIEIEAAVPLERIARGGEETVRYRRVAPCTECKGSGAKPGTQPRACASCGPRAPAGDLLVVVRAAPDPRFERLGADLWRLQELAVADAVLGTELDVPTLDGPTAVKVPPGTQPGSQLRLRGKGLPRFGARGRGDLYVRLAVKLPERLSAEQRSLWERLRASNGRLPASGVRKW